jgi:hypothetical protein
LDAATAVLGHVRSLESHSGDGVGDGDRKDGDFQIYSSTLKLVISQLSHTSVSVADMFAAVLESLCVVRPTITGDILQWLLPIPKDDATLMIRYYAIIFKIIPPVNKRREYLLTFDESTATRMERDLMKPFLVGLQNDQDPLLQMGLLEILQQASDARNDDFIHNWYEPDLDRSLLKMVGQQDQNGELHPFCSGAALKMLSNRDKFLSRQEFLSVLLHFARHMSGEVEKIGFIDGITTFCCHESIHDTEGSSNLGLILQNQELLDEWLNFRVAQSKLRAVVMNSVSKVLGVESILHANRLELYQMIGRVNNVGRDEDTTQIIMQYVRGQVVELRLAAYDILTAVAKVHMGAHMLMRFGGFFEFLCNRNLEVVKEGKELKYGLVKAIVSSEVRGLLADDVVRALEQVVLDGPYFVKKIRDVAIE